MKMSEAIEFLWGHIVVGGLNECWPWIGHVSKYGYGTYNGLYEHLGTNRCHRQVYIITRGRSDYDQILHSCDNRRCCNPLHLRNGSHQENMDDMVKRGREAHHGVSQPGSSNGSSKLLEEQVKLILQDDRTLKMIALDYNISKVRVSQIKRGLAWKHLPRGKGDDDE